MCSVVFYKCMHCGYSKVFPESHMDVSMYYPSYICPKCGKSGIGDKSITIIDPGLPKYSAKPCGKCGAKMEIKHDPPMHYYQCVNASGCNNWAKIDLEDILKKDEEYIKELAENKKKREKSSELKKSEENVEEDDYVWDLHPLPQYSDDPCEKCGGRMIKKNTWQGGFYSCENSPECKNRVEIDLRDILKKDEEYLKKKNKWWNKW